MLLRVYRTTVRVCNFYVDATQASCEIRDCKIFRVYNTRDSKILRVYMKRDSKVLRVYKIPVRVSTFYLNVKQATSDIRDFKLIRVCNTTARVCNGYLDIGLVC